MNLIEKLQSLNACKEGIDYIGDQSAKEAWDNCERGDWMLWIAQRQKIDLKILTLAKVRCVSLVKHLMKDERSLNALEVAERFANGKATREELDAAAADAAPAVAAAAAAYAADAADADAVAADAAAVAAAAAAAADAVAADAADADAAAYAADADAAAYAAAVAVDAVAAAYAATAYADAYAAAYAISLKKCADICRETIPFELLEIE